MRDVEAQMTYAYVQMCDAEVQMTDADVQMTDAEVQMHDAEAQIPHFPSKIPQKHRFSENRPLNTSNLCKNILADVGVITNIID